VKLAGREHLRSVASVPNECWATDLCCVWSCRDGWAVLALVICETHNLA
jgi:putative transposase